MVGNDSEWLTVKQFLKRYDGVVGRNLIYDLIRDGSLPHVRLHRKLLIPANAFEKILDGDDNPLVGVKD